MPEINYALRNHVTDTAFSLRLGKTHVAALVYIDVMIKASRAAPARSHMHISTNKVENLALRRDLAHFVPGARGLRERGLVEHHFVGNKPFHYHYKITKAGRLVMNLLIEAGIYQEYANALPAAMPVNLPA